MDINTYLPDALGERAKAAGLKGRFSALLQDAVAEELDRLELLEQASDGMVPQEVEATSSDGEPVLLRFTGKDLGGYGLGIYLTDEGVVIVVFEEDYAVFDTVDKFTDWVNSTHRNILSREEEEGLAEAVVELGGRRVIDL